MRASNLNTFALFERFAHSGGGDDLSQLLSWARAGLEAPDGEAQVHAAWESFLNTAFSTAQALSSNATTSEKSGGVVGLFKRMVKLSGQSVPAPAQAPGSPSPPSVDVRLSAHVLRLCYDHVCEVGGGTASRRSSVGSTSNSAPSSAAGSRPSSDQQLHSKGPSLLGQLAATTRHQRSFTMPEGAVPVAAGGSTVNSSSITSDSTSAGSGTTIAANGDASAAASTPGSPSIAATAYPSSSAWGSP